MHPLLRLPTFTGALELASACWLPLRSALRSRCRAFENAAKGRLVVCFGSGHDGEGGNLIRPSTRDWTPVDAPSVISLARRPIPHFFLETVNVPGTVAHPSNLQGLPTHAGDAFIPQGAKTESRWT